MAENFDNFPPPRAFQAAAIEKLRDGVRSGNKNQMLMAPTGAGKTFVALRMAFDGAQKGKRTVFMCDRRTLIQQTARTAYKYGIRDQSIIMGDAWSEYRPEARLQICSAQTIERRQWPEADLILVDEAHTKLKVWTEYVRQTKAIVIGLSATPFSKGLGLYFDRLVNVTTMGDLTRDGVLVPMRVFTCRRPNMKGAKTNSAGEWADSDAGKRGMEIIGDVVLEWRRLGENRKTICFGSSIEHCENLARAFNEAGVPAALFTSHTKEQERKELLAEFEKPDSFIKVLISVEALAKGFDVQDVGCVIDCRPLRKSLSTFIQMVGRGARSSPGKTDFILIDHSGNIVRFAKDFERIYHEGLDDLDSGKDLDSTVRKDDEQEREERACPNCGFSPFRKTCMSCGHEKVTTSEVIHEAGQAVAFELGKSKAQKQAEQSFYSQLLGYQQLRGYQEGWAAHNFKKKFKRWPDGLSKNSVDPGVEVSRWVKSQAIRWSKAQLKSRDRVTQGAQA